MFPGSLSPQLQAAKDPVMALLDHQHQKSPKFFYNPFPLSPQILNQQESTRFPSAMTEIPSFGFRLETGSVHAAVLFVPVRGRHWRSITDIPNLSNPAARLLWIQCIWSRSNFWICGLRTPKIASGVHRDQSDIIGNIPENLMIGWCPKLDIKEGLEEVGGGSDGIHNVL